MKALRILAIAHRPANVRIIVRSIPPTLVSVACASRKLLVRGLICLRLSAVATYIVISPDTIPALNSPPSICRHVRGMARNRSSISSIPRLNTISLAIWNPASAIAAILPHVRSLVGIVVMGSICRLAASPVSSRRAVISVTCPYSPTHTGQPVDLITASTFMITALSSSASIAKGAGCIRLASKDLAIHCTHPSYIRNIYWWVSPCPCTIACRSPPRATTILVASPPCCVSTPVESILSAAAPRSTVTLCPISAVSGSINAPSGTSILICSCSTTLRVCFLRAVILASNILNHVHPLASSASYICGARGIPSSMLTGLGSLRICVSRPSTALTTNRVKRGYPKASSSEIYCYRRRGSWHNSPVASFLGFPSHSTYLCSILIAPVHRRKYVSEFR